MPQSSAERTVVSHDAAHGARRRASRSSVGTVGGCIPTFATRGKQCVQDTASDTATRSACFRERIRHLFTFAKASVDEELSAGSTQQAAADNGSSGQNGGKALGNGHAAGQTNGRRRDGNRPATASQMRALNAIADRRKLDLPALLGDRFQIHDAAALTITEASSLIDELKGEAVGNGNGGRR